MDDGDEVNRRFLIQVLEFLAADSEAQVGEFPESPDVPELLTLLWHDSFEENREVFESGLVTSPDRGALFADFANRARVLASSSPTSRASDTRQRGRPRTRPPPSR